MEPVQHPFHDHPLVLHVSSQESRSPHEQFSCSGCAAPILSGPIFVCSLNCGFTLHKSCAESPPEITHFLHAQHPLVLQEKSTNESGPNTCDHCEDTIKGFRYGCSICDFDLDVLCASLTSSYVEPEEEGHKHKFIMVKPSLSLFTCDTCGRENKGASYLCITCQLRVHPACSFLPIRVKLFTHSCPLKLTFGHQLEKPIDKIKQSCRICFQKFVDARYGFYYCVDCEYISDIQCAMWKQYRDYQFDAETYSPTRRYIDEGKIDLQNWHEHGLLLCNDDPATTNTTGGHGVVCRVCVSEISSGPFYECKEKCGYVLHESCANLYEKIRHPLHGAEHDLVLVDGGTFRCSLCEMPCSGFRYCCKQEGCESAAMDIKCALRSDVIHIERAHQHPLRIIRDAKHNDKKCKGCSSGCYAIRYACPDPDCDYNLCDICVGMPTSAKHRWDEHPLELTCESTPHEDGEYYCDECEEPRDTDHWFYHCAICERDVHTECMGLHNLNLTLTNEFPNFHPGHKLIIVANPQFYPTCTTCGLPCKDLYYQCLDCEFRIHYFECTSPAN